MLQRVADFLKKYKLNDKTVIVGFSGGFDSMCLLDILSKLVDLPEFYQMKVIAAHFNHNWRGEESLKEQEVCRIFASSKGVEFYTRTGKEPLKKTENEARIARYDFFEEVMEEYDSDVLLTAHNKDDNAETVLYRIAKGTGLYGLQGIQEKRDCFYRPLLTTTRAEILDYCNKNNLTPNEDSSNNCIDYNRNYLRLNVIPSLERINEQVKDALNTLATVAKSDNDIIEEFLSTIRPNVFDGDKILSKNFINLSRPVKMRLLHEYVQKLGLDYDYKKIVELYNFIESNISQRNGSTMSLTTSSWLYADEKIVEVIPPKQDENKEVTIVIKKEGEFQIGQHKFVLRKQREDDIFNFPEATAKFAYVDLSNEKFPLILRTRQDGDVISPLGMYGTMKLKKYLNSKGVPRHNRDNLLLLCNKNEVLWVIGVGISDKIKVKLKPTHVIEFI